MKGNFRSGNYIKRALKGVAQGVLLFVLLFGFISCNLITDADKVSNAAVKDEIYYCPMHPEVEQDHPGTCPKPVCKGMELVLKEPEGTFDLVLEPANSVVLSAMKTIHPEEKEVETTVEATGYIDYDERTGHSIAAVMSGRIEKLYVKSNYQAVSKGQKVFDIYSPELVTAQQDLLYLLKTDKDATDLINAAKQKLRILEMGEGDISRLVVDRKLRYSVPVYSKWSGNIQEINASPAQGASGGAGDMSMRTNTGSPSAARPTGNSGSPMTVALAIKEGMYVSRGQTVFNVVDPQRIVVKLQIKGRDIGSVKVNQQVTLEIDEDPQLKVKGKVNIIDPFLQAGKTTVLARVDIVNDKHNYKVGTLVKATITGEKISGVWVPASAVVSRGKSKIVWVKDGNGFKAQKIETGMITKDWVEVTDGISKRNEIAIEGHYMADSEGFIKTANDDE